MKYVSDVETPLGTIRVVANDTAVIAVGFDPGRNVKLRKLGLSGAEGSSDLTKRAAVQLQEYFAGRRTAFELPVSFEGMSAFSRTVLQCLCGVPFGELLSYGALAELAGRPKAARAIGRVMAANPVPIIVPCHRIVGATGKMTGYSGGDGIPTKEWLLAFERQSRVS